LTSRSRDGLETQFQTSRSRLGLVKMREGLDRSRSRLGLKIKRLGLVSFSHHKVSFTSRLIYIFIMFALTLKRVQFYIRFIQFIKHFPYARRREGYVLTFYLFNEIRFTSL